MKVHSKQFCSVKKSTHLDKLLQSIIKQVIPFNSEVFFLRAGC